MSLETGLNLGLLHKNTALSKRHNTFLSGISCWKGKYASCDAKCLVLHFSELFLIFIITMIRYWNDKIKRHLKGSINFFDHIWQQSCFEIVFNFIFLYKRTVDSKKKLQYFATCFILYVACSDGEIYFYNNLTVKSIGNTF